MKHPELIVKIPKPCHENWNQMSPTEKGKFCNMCRKEVIDFTAHSDEEVLRYFSKHKNICGRFHGSQLNRKLIADRKKRNHWLSYAASLLLPMSLFAQETASNDQKVTNTELEASTTHYKSLNIGAFKRKAQIKTTAQKDSITVKGIITDDDGLPLPGTAIYVNNTNKGTLSDFDGNYVITIVKGKELVFSYVGYHVQIVKATVTTIDIQLTMDTNLHFIGEVVTASPDKRYKSNFSSLESEERKQRTQNYFAFQRKKWLKKRAERRAKRAARKAERQANASSNS
ncbi:MAG: carboxypeptidase-like regulatory domain-containing protein [Bacteroidota bacterium]